MFRTLLIAGALVASGSLLFVQDSTLFAQAFDEARRALRGEPIPVAQNLTYDRGIWRAPFHASANGILAYQAGGAPATGQPSWFNASGQALGTVGEKDLFFDVQLSPDGRRVAAAVGDTSDIWIYDLARNVRSRFTFDPANETEPVWSPDGSRIVFASDRVATTRASAPGGPAIGPGRFALFVKPAGGGRTEERLLDSALNQEPNDWSSDGRFLAYVQGDPTRKTREDVWILPMAGERQPFPYLETESSEGEARFSPDGRFVSYTSDESGRREVYVAPFPEPRDKWQVSSAGGRLPMWRRDGSELFYLAPDRTMMAVPILVPGAFDAEAPRRLFQSLYIPVGDINISQSYDVTADGMRFLAAAADPGSPQSPLTVITR